MVLWSATQLWPARPQIVEEAVFHGSDVIYYEAPEYLQPLDTGGTHAPAEKKGDPEFARQPILSVPANADNHRQTIVTPPNLKLNSDVALPNVVAWGKNQPTIPLAATAPRTKLDLPSLPTAVVAPPPEVRKTRLNNAPRLDESVIAPPPAANQAASNRNMQLPMPAIVEPPPSVDTASSRRLSDINIGRSQVVAPAPQLPMGEQRAISSAGRPSLGNAEPAVVAPPPSVQGTDGGRSDGQLVALSLRPAAPSGPIDVPNGNRRGTFAATPQGRPGASGTPDPPAADKSAGSGVGGRGTGNGAGSGKAASELPPGLFVGAPKSGAGSEVAGNGGSGSGSSEPRLTVNAGSRAVAREMDTNQQTDDERRVFAGRKSYSMTLNMPNLNSAGGSWVMHFVELKDDKVSGDLFAPVPTHTADPGYPLELMKSNVHGTVMLSAVIHSDGRVSEVAVVNGIDDRLDQYACAALLRWQFLPALRNGSPVPLKAVVMIPFRPRRAF